MQSREKSIVASSCVCVFMCVCERDGESNKSVCVCVCVCERDGKREGMCKCVCAQTKCMLEYAYLRACVRLPACVRE